MEKMLLKEEEQKAERNCLFNFDFKEYKKNIKSMLKKIYRLKKKKEFSYVYLRGEKHISKCKYVSIYRTPSSKLSIGFSVSKKIGNAVTRNLYKRRLQHIAKKYLSLLNKGHYIIVANADIKKASFQQLQLDIDILFSTYKF